MLREIIVDLDRRTVDAPSGAPDVFGKTLAVERVIAADDPERTLYLSGYTPLAASGLGFSGKLNVYGVSLLGRNLQGSRSGGLIGGRLTRLGVVGIRVVGESRAPLVLVIDGQARPRLAPLSEYGDSIAGTSEFARRLYASHGEDAGLAVTDPATTAFLYNAILCNSKPGGRPDRAAARSTTNFGRNGLIGVVAERAPAPLHAPDCDRAAAAALLRQVHAARSNANLTGDDSEANPLLGGTYGGAAKARFEGGHGLTDLFRSASVRHEVYESLLPETLVREKLELAARSGVRITRHSCLPGCPNRCAQVVLLTDERGEVTVARSGEWETYQGVINLGLFDAPMRVSAEIIEHSNEFAYDHIEALVALAALALAHELGHDSGVRYGDRASVMAALYQAAEGRSELGRLLRQGAAAVERRYGMERHFTIGGHALPFHNGRSMLQTGVGLSWTFGRHGESCAGPGRHNFLGQPYDPADHSLAPQIHVLNAIHGMVLYGALDEHGMCFFAGPSVDTLVDAERILQAMGVEADVAEMVRRSARTILDVYEFNCARGVRIEPLPRVFYETPTYGNGQGPADAVVFNVPFEAVRDHGLQVLREIASGECTIAAATLAASRARYGDAGGGSGGSTPVRPE